MTTVYYKMTSSQFNGYLSLFQLDATNFTLTGIYELVSNVTQTSLISSNYNLLFPNVVGTYGSYTVLEAGGSTPLKLQYSGLSSSSTYTPNFATFTAPGSLSATGPPVVSNVSYYKNTGNTIYNGANLATNSGNLYIFTNRFVNGNYVDSPSVSSPVVFTANFVPPAFPVVSNICFPLCTPIQTDQGTFNIETLDTNHSIDSMTIIAITKTISTDSYVVCFDAHSVDIDCPTKQTVMTINHSIWHQGMLKKAIRFVNHNTIRLIPYDGTYMYNVLLPIHHHMNVNGLRCETLHPEHQVAQFYSLVASFSKEEQDIAYSLLLDTFQEKIDTQPYQTSYYIHG